MNTIDNDPDYEKILRKSYQLDLLLRERFKMEQIEN